MEWTDLGFIISQRPLGDKDLILGIFTQERGLVRAFLKAGQSSKKRSLIEIGNKVQARFYARLSDQLGSWDLDLLEQPYVYCYAMPIKFSLLQSLMDILSQSLQEHDPHPAIYQQIEAFFQELKQQNDRKAMIAYYCLLELFLIKDLGFGFNFDYCGACQKHHENFYLSPKTGAAACRQAGEDFHDRLLVIPKFYQDMQSTAEDEDLIQALRINAHFIQQWILEPAGKSLSDMRLRIKVL